MYTIFKIQKVFYDPNDLSLLALLLVVITPLQYYGYKRLVGFKNERAAIVHFIRSLFAVALALVAIIQPLKQFSPFLQTSSVIVLTIIFLWLIFFWKKS